MNYHTMIVRKYTFTKDDISNDFSFLFLLAWVSATSCMIRKKEKTTIASATDSMTQLQKSGNVKIVPLSRC